MKRIITVGVAALLSVLTVTGCSTTDKEALENAEINSAKGAYAFVAKDIQNPYMQKVYEGFETACGEIGVNTLYKSPDSTTAEEQIEIIKQLTEQKVGGIAVVANDEDALTEALGEAMDNGIKVVSLDSAVNKESRHVHIQQANPEIIGRGLIQAAYDIVGGNGGIAVLSATAQATNQNMWIDYMKKELEENKDKYAKTPLVSIVYGDDDPIKSAVETEGLINNPDVKVIIAPTTVGILAAAQVIEENGSNVKLTGLGFPSEMSQYIGGICPWMYLWDTVDIGYLAGYTMDALVKGSITGAVGESFIAGDMGVKTITTDTDSGSEVMLGDLLKFDSSNIDQWKDIY